MHDAGRQAARPQVRRGSRSNVAALLLGVRVVGLVGDREVRAHTGEPKFGSIVDVGGELDRDTRVTAHAMHSGVDLEVHRDRIDSGDRRGLGERVDATGGVDDGGEPVRDTASAAAGTGSDSTRIGASMPASRRCTPSSTSATASHVAPASIAARPTGTDPWP